MKGIVIVSTVATAFLLAFLFALEGVRALLVRWSERRAWEREWSALMGTQ